MDRVSVRRPAIAVEPWRRDALVDVSVENHIIAAMFAKQIIPDLCTVVLRHSVESKGHVWAKGQRGTVLHAWSDGKHYLVEFTDEPTSYVVDVGRDDIYLA